MEGYEYRFQARQMVDHSPVCCMKTHSLGLSCLRVISSRACNCFDVERPAMTSKSFSPDLSDRLTTFDANAEASGHVVKGDTSRRVAVATENEAMAGLLLMPQHILIMVYRNYRRDDSKTDHVSQASTEKLGTVSIETALAAFIFTRKTLLIRFKAQPTELHLYSRFYSRLRKAPGLLTTIAQGQRQQFCHEDKSYDFLFAAATHLVQQRRKSCVCSSKSLTCSRGSAWPQSLKKNLSVLQDSRSG